MLQTIGRYEIKAEVGRGGMATVYRAFDPYFERDVAIKVLPKEFLHDPQFRIRFEREAKTIASLEHHSIVPLYDFGEVDGQPYIVIRLMSGGTLSDLLNNGALPIFDVVNIISRIASALDAAHARGIIHRDLKPGNILLDQYGMVFLSDFGIARLVEAGGPTITGLTGSAIIGTPVYMSPEQIQGEKVDGRSDIYALGVILFQMLTGQLPFKTDTPTRAIMANIFETVPSILKLKPNLPFGCDEVVQKALAKDREDRFPTAGEMAIALQAAVYGEINGIPLYPLGHLSQSSKKLWFIKYPLKTRLAAIIAVVIITIGVLSAILYRSSLFTNLPPIHQNLSEASTPSQVNTESAIDTSPLANTIIPTLSNIWGTAQIQSTTTRSFQSTMVVTSTPPGIPVIAGADKIAFMKMNNIWIMNLDGSDLTQLTNDGTDKYNPHWSNDGEEIYFIIGKCIKSVDIYSKTIDEMACFESSEQLNDFVISPDNQIAVIILNNKLYFFSYDRDRLKLIRSRKDVQDMGLCEFTSPYDYQNILIKSLQWSNHSYRIAVIMEGYLSLGADKFEKRDIIQLLDNTPNPSGKCKRYLPVVDQFPYFLSDSHQIIAKRFPIIGYEEKPFFQNFGWDGGNLFTFVGNRRNDGFGDLYIYNSESGTAELQINPIDSSCCYRDPQWSPDGRYLLLVYQSDNPIGNNNILFYYIKYATIGAGETYEPIPIPANFFSNPNEKPIPILRPYKIDNTPLYNTILTPTQLTPTP